jgi:glycosyltransferase involved in cell wall biosynthesis
MRVLFISNYFPPHHVGGYEELCQEVAEGLERRGHDLAVLTSRRGEPSSADHAGPVFRWLHTEIDYDAGQIPLQFLIGRGRRARKNLVALERVLREWQPDVVMVWAMWNLSREILAHIETRVDIPIVYYLADYWPTLPDAFVLHWQAPARHPLARWPKSLMAGLSRRLSRGRHSAAPLAFERVLCVSAAVRDRLVRDGVRFGDVRVVHNGISLSTPPLRSLLNRRLTGTEIRAVYLGRLTAEKGLDVALRALALARGAGVDVHLSIVGSGASWYEDELVNQASTLGISSRVSFLGRVERSVIPEILAGAHVMVVPSIWPDPLPRVIQEGMEAGMVVVASAVGGIPEIVEHEVNGLLFRPGDASDLAQQLQRIHDDPGLAAELAEKAVSTVRDRFDIEGTVNDVENYLLSLGPPVSRERIAETGALMHASVIRRTHRGTNAFSEPGHPLARPQ